MTMRTLSLVLGAALLVSGTLVPARAEAGWPIISIAPFNLMYVKKFCVPYLAYTDPRSGWQWGYDCRGVNLPVNPDWQPMDNELD